MPKEINRFSNLTDEEWEEEVLKIDTNPENYNTGKIAKIFLTLSAILWIGLLILIIK